MKNTSFLFVVIFFSFLWKAAAQKSIEVAVNHTVILNYVDYVVYADVLANDRKVKPDLETFYYWYKANDIKKSRGGYEGKLLHGSYTEFYQNKNLKEKGNFKLGIKTGLWKSWHPNGELAALVNWKNGKMHGQFRLYDVSGNLLKKGKYKNDKLEGKVYSYSSDAVSEVAKYKNGKLKVQKNKKNLSEKDIIIKDKKRFSKIYFRRNKKRNKPAADSLANKSEQLKTNSDAIPTSEKKRYLFSKKKEDSGSLPQPERNKPQPEEKKKVRLRKEKSIKENSGQ
jgi:hypothetical protein